ncbi:MAG: hypothetical protein CMI27_03925 [Opitutae bacterium]|nr:hypothetical protein [Opitutae bacterium]
MKMNSNVALFTSMIMTFSVTTMAQNENSPTNFGTIEKLNEKVLQTPSRTFAQSTVPMTSKSSSPSVQRTAPSASQASTSVPTSSNKPATVSPSTALQSQPAPARIVAPQPPPPIGSPRSPYSFKSYRLSYMQSDRVLGLLKALGYSTVEYTLGRGESVYSNIYTALPVVPKYPLVVKLLDSSKTSLMQPALDGGRNATGANSLGGTYLHSSTTGAPEQRLLIVYEKQYPEQLNGLLNLLRNEIDVAANQVVIECLVVEIKSNTAKTLGLEYNLEDKKVRTSFDQSGLSSEFNSFTENKFGNNSSTYIDSSTGLLTYRNTGLTRTVPLNFRAKLNASIIKGETKVLTNPSILVLDGRQALIRIGTQIPVSQTNTTSTGISRVSYTYVNTGIVLNIRPRISEDGSEVTMQTETIVSSYDNTIAIGKDTPPPSIENKTIQSIVRVSDNTPFIIAGLIEDDENDEEKGIPILSDLPVLGNLFKNTTESSEGREVIIVLTPHIMNAEEKSFSYVIPKDSQNFDSFDNLLFRNAYRIRDDDLFDLSFATQSDFYKKILTELQQYKQDHPEIPEDYPLFSYLKDKVPGEDVIVRRMIWEIVHKSKYNQYIADDHILLFEENEEAKFGNKFKTHLLSLLFNRINEGTENSLVFDLSDHKARAPGPFEHPRAIISMDQVTDSANYVERMSLLNAEDENRNTLLLCPSVSPPGVRGATAMEVLKGVLVLKRILALNSTMPVTIDEFRVGRQITFPTEQELRDKYHVIDYDTARFFYEVINYYPEFEKAFNRDTASIILELRGFKNQ